MWKQRCESNFEELTCIQKDGVRWEFDVIITTNRNVRERAVAIAHGIVLV